MSAAQLSSTPYAFQENGGEGKGEGSNVSFCFCLLLCLSFHSSLFVFGTGYFAFAFLYFVIFAVSLSFFCVFCLFFSLRLWSLRFCFVVLRYHYYFQRSITYGPILLLCQFPLSPIISFQWLSVDEKMSLVSINHYLSTDSYTIYLDDVIIT